MDKQSNRKDNKIQERRDERSQAFNFVFERMFRDDTIDDAFEDAENARDIQVSEYTRKVVEGVEEHLDEIDTLIEKNLKGWKKNRISKISLTILRIAVFEMLYMKNIPMSVSINEAVELAKNYATAADGSFVNGVLGSIAKSLKKSGEN
ncbi:MAG: transcription antitermination factor NusB [Clostridia bacterium]|nr:transcription antitermination factor NusB [Clostridia bacterium]